MDITNRLKDSTGKNDLKIGALANQPKNTNFQESNSFKFYIKKIPNTVYFCQSVNLPGMSIDSLQQNTPFNSINYPGTSVSFENLSISFLVSEDMKNWLEIYNWIRSCSTIKDFSEIVALESSLSSDANITLYSSKNNINFNVRFTNLFPTSISSINFNYSDSEILPILCDVSFAYTYYEIVS